MRFARNLVFFVNSKTSDIHHNDGLLRRSVIENEVEIRAHFLIARSEIEVLSARGMAMMAYWCSVNKGLC